MARRKRKQDNALPLLVGAACIYVLYEVISHDLPVVILLAIVVGVIVALAIVLPARRNRRHLFETANAIIEQHADQLAKVRAQVVRQDPYGKPVLEKWHSEIDYFITEHIRPSLTIKQQSMLESTRADIKRMIMSRAESVTQQTPIFKAFSGTMKPRESEAFCAEQLRACGWDAQLTPTTGDQGVDVIAEKHGSRVVLQCKLYSVPVGNFAIQEIVAGKAMSVSVCPLDTIHAPVERVWSFLSEPANYALWWDAQTRSIVPDGPASPGQKIYVLRPLPLESIGM